MSIGKEAVTSSGMEEIQQSFQMNKGKKEKDSNIIECAKGEKLGKQKQ